MSLIRHLIVCVLLMALTIPSVFAQSQSVEPPRLKISLPAQWPPDASAPRPDAYAAMHPAAKGALIGAATGAAFWGGVGLWYCTIGPNEAGECRNADMWTRGFLTWSAVGAGVGALIGALRQR